jgi:hypothetical protein
LKKIEFTEIECFSCGSKVFSGITEGLSRKNIKVQTCTCPSCGKEAKASLILEQGEKDV